MLESSSTWATQTLSLWSLESVTPVSSQQTPPPSRKKLVLFALVLGLAALFMYVSFILKTAVRGP